MSERTERLTIERLREVLNYDPETGIFTWATHKWKRKIGAIAYRGEFLPNEEAA